MLPHISGATGEAEKTTTKSHVLGSSPLICAKFQVKILSVLFQRSAQASKSHTLKLNFHRNHALAHFRLSFLKCLAKQH